MSEYKVTTTARTARPRSKRLRELGVTGAVSVSSSGVQTAVEGSSGTDHTHANKSLLDSLSLNEELYLLTSQMVTVTNTETDSETGEEVQTTSEELQDLKIKAGDSDMWGGWLRASYLDQPLLQASDVTHRSLRVDAAGGVRIGDAVLRYDAEAGGIYVVGVDGAAAGFYATGYVSAGGLNTNSSTALAVNLLKDWGDTVNDEDALSASLGKELYNNITTLSSKVATLEEAASGGTIVSGDYLPIDGGTMLGDINLGKGFSLRTYNGVTDSFNRVLYSYTADARAYNVFGDVENKSDSAATVLRGRYIVFTTMDGDNPLNEVMALTGKTLYHHGNISLDGTLTMGSAAINIENDGFTFSKGDTILELWSTTSELYTSLIIDGGLTVEGDVSFKSVFADKLILSDYIAVNTFKFDNRIAIKQDGDDVLFVYDDTATQTERLLLSVANDGHIMAGEIFEGDLAGNAGSADKVNHKLTVGLNGSEIGTFDGSSDLSVSIDAAARQHSHTISEVSGLSDRLSSLAADIEEITGSYVELSTYNTFVNGYHDTLDGLDERLSTFATIDWVTEEATAYAATKLAAEVNIFGRPFDGTADVEGTAEIDKLIIGDAILTWDDRNKCLSVSTSMYSVGAVTAGGVGTLQGRKIWGQSLEGRTDITGALTGVTDITASGDVLCGSVHYSDSLTSGTAISLAATAWQSIPLYSDGTKIRTSASYWKSYLPELVDTDADGALTLDYACLGTVLGILNSNRIISLEARVKALEDKA